MIEITCTLLGTPFFSSYLSLMFLVFVAIDCTGWFPPSFKRFPTAPESRSLVIVSVFLSVYFCRLSQYPLLSCLLNFCLTSTMNSSHKTTVLPALCLPVSTHACPTDPTLVIPLHPCLPAHDLWTVALSLWFIINHYFLLELGLANGSFTHFLKLLPLTTCV